MTAPLSQPPASAHLPPDDPARAAAELLPSGASEMSIDDALGLAVRMHRQDRLEGATQIYRRILQAVPGHPDAMALLGMAEHQMGRSDEGVALVRAAIQRAPGFAGFQVNLGNMLSESGRLDEARQAYERARELEPGRADTLNNLGVLYQALRRHDEARASFERAIELDPGHVRAWNNLGILLDVLGQPQESVRAYLKAVDLSPGHAGSIFLLGMTFYNLGQLDKATQVFKHWMEREPDNPRPAHLYAACSGQAVPKRAPDAYVEAEFDGFARSFERVLTERLEYRAPQLCADLLASRLGEPKAALDVLDVGCGTGLCGPLVAPWARRLVGVDLSSGMLSKARGKGVYDELVKAELTGFLQGTPSAWDAAVCADTLCYFGDLGEVMQATAAALRPGAPMVYTVEAQDDDTSSEARIQPNGRYVHGRAHLERTAAAAGLELLHAERQPLRIEGRSEVQGWLVAVARPAATAARQTP